MADLQAPAGDVLLRDYAYSTYFYRARVSGGETLDVVRAPEFWAHCTKLLKVGDRVEILADDGSWEWHGRVMGREPTKVYLRQTFYWQLTDADNIPKPQREEYEIGWGGPQHKHRVIAKSDNRVVRHGFDDKQQAEQYLADLVAGRVKDAA